MRLICIFDLFAHIKLYSLFRTCYYNLIFIKYYSMSCLLYHLPKPVAQFHNLTFRDTKTVALRAKVYIFV